MSEREDVRFLQGDCLQVLKTLPSESVHACISSPPYFNLRSYLDDDHEHKAQEIGLEASPTEHALRLVEVFREVRRVLRVDGCLLLNYGDAYAANRPGGQPPPTNTGNRKGYLVSGPQGVALVHPGYKPKDLMEMPSEVVRALRQDGWWLRSRMPWVKRNSMPESTTDRPSTAVEYVFLLSKRANYYWDADAVRRGMLPESAGRYAYAKQDTGVSRRQPGGERVRVETKVVDPNPNGRNLRNSDFYFDSLDLLIEEQRAFLSHLTHLREKGGLLLSEDGEPLALDVNPQALRESHFASFPLKLVSPLIQAATSEHGCCARCGSPWVREVERDSYYRHLTDEQKKQKTRKTNMVGNGHGGAGRGPKNNLGETLSKTLGWRKSCRCETDAVEPAVVLDPFCGSGTVMLAATKLGRRSIGIDLNSDYLSISHRRNSQLGLLL